MAHAIAYEHDATGFGAVARWVARTRKALADFRRYRQTVEELQALSDRELADLNIARYAIRDVAYDSGGASARERRIAEAVTGAAGCGESSGPSEPRGTRIPSRLGVLGALGPGTRGGGYKGASPRSNAHHP
jgi:uncharacterized protein YjiS (DUF1127 family)